MNNNLVPGRSRYWVLLLLFLIPSFLFSQEEEGFHLLSVEEYFKFDNYNSPEMSLPFRVLENRELKVQSLWGNQFYQEAEVLNEYTQITSAHYFEQYIWDEGRRRKVEIEIEYEPYDLNGIFHSNYRLGGYGHFFSETKMKEITIEKRYDDPRYLTSVYFHERYPSGSKSIAFEINEDYKYVLHEMNFEGYEIKKDTLTRDYKKYIKYTLEDIPPRPTDPNSPGSAKYLPHILVQLQSYTNEAGEVIPVFEDVGGLYKWYHSITEGTENESENLDETYAEIVKGKTTDREKAEAIFYWVQDNVRYIAFEDGIAAFRPDGDWNVCSKMYGDCKGMANLTKSLLQKAELDAHLTWLGTSRIPYDYSTPSLAVDNHMICTLYLDGKPYFLDATEKFIGFGDYANRIQGKQVLVEDGESYKLERIPEFGADRNKEIQIHKIRLEGDKMVGKGKSIYNGERKTGVLRAMHQINPLERKKVYEEYLTEGSRAIQISDISFSDLEDRNSPVTIDFDYEMAHRVATFGSEIYLDFALNQDYRGSVLDTNRLAPVEFSGLSVTSEIYEFEIPAGYTLEYLPESFKKEVDGILFNFNFASQGSKVIFNKEIRIDRQIMEVEYVEAWNEAILQLNDIYNGQIVFAKKGAGDE